MAAKGTASPLIKYDHKRLKDSSHLERVHAITNIAQPSSISLSLFTVLSAYRHPLSLPPFSHTKKPMPNPVTAFSYASS
jgi:hypothetical protein